MARLSYTDLLGVERPLAITTKESVLMKLHIDSLKSHSTILIAGLQYGVLVVFLFILYDFTNYSANIVISRLTMPVF